MSRDHKKLKVFQMADALVVGVYQCSRRFPADERFGLRSPVRRAAVSVAANIVEGCARRTTRDYANFLQNALASASEARYLIDLAQRLEFLDSSATLIESRYGDLVRALQGLIDSLSTAL